MTPFRSILVVLDARVDPGEMLEDALTLALASRAKVTLLSVVPPIPAMAWLAPQLPWDPHYEAEQLCVAALARARARCPDGISVTTVLSRESARSAVRCEAQRGDHDLILVAPGPGGRLTSWLRRWSAARLEREMSIPFLPVAELRPGA